MDDTEVMLADAVQDFLQDRQHKERLRKTYAGQSAYDPALWTDMAGQGWLGITLAESLGGVGLAPRHAAVIARGLGRHAMPEPFVASAALVARLANRLHAQHAAAWQGIARQLLSGDAVLAPAWQEDAATLDAMPRCVGQAVDGGAELTGTKHAVIAADIAAHYLVSGVWQGLPALWRVPTSANGVRAEIRTGSDGSSAATVAFTQVFVGDAQCLARGDEVIAALREARDEAILLTSAQLLGLAEQGFAITLDYLRTRVQFGKAIGSFQSLQHMAVDVRVQLSLAQAAVRVALRAFESQPAAEGTRAAIARAKARASQVALQSGKFGVQAHGAIGFAAEADIGLYLKGALRLSAYLGNASHHRQALAFPHVEAEGATP
ncbi:MAG: acyl-CoA dehydrogenase family protein [Comamonas sp.]